MHENSASWNGMVAMVLDYWFDLSSVRHVFFPRKLPNENELFSFFFSDVDVGQTFSLFYRILLSQFEICQGFSILSDKNYSTIGAPPRRSLKSAEIGRDILGLS